MSWLLQYAKRAVWPRLFIGGAVVAATYRDPQQVSGGQMAAVMVAALFVIPAVVLVVLHRLDGGRVRASIVGAVGVAMVALSAPFVPGWIGGTVRIAGVGLVLAAGWWMLRAIGSNLLTTTGAAGRPSLGGR